MPWQGQRVVVDTTGPAEWLWEKGPWSAFGARALKYIIF